MNTSASLVRLTLPGCGSNRCSGTRHALPRWRSEADYVGRQVLRVLLLWVPSWPPMHVQGEMSWCVREG